MEPYKLSVYIHVALTLIAFAAGSIALVTQPKGNKTHRKAGMLYFVTFLAAGLTGFFMLFLKYKALLLGVTIVNLYLCITGFKAVRYKGAPPGWVDWLMLVVLGGSGVLLLSDGLRIYNGLFGSDFGWVCVRFFYIFLIAYTLISDMRYFIQKTDRKRLWLPRHIEKMLISFIALLTGVILRGIGDLDFFAARDLKWIFWIIAYILCLPFVFFWVRRYSIRQPK